MTVPTACHALHFRARQLPLPIHNRHTDPPHTQSVQPQSSAAHLTLSKKALLAARRSFFRPFRFSMMLLPRMQALALSISATS